MAVIREYLCSDCGATFESTLTIDEVSCPHCSGEDAERVFLTPPGITSPKTSSTDRTLQSLAQDFGLSDMSNREGQAVKRAPEGPAAPQFATGNPQALQMIQKLGSNADSFSPVLPALQRAGRPHQWRKTPERR